METVFQREFVTKSTSLEMPGFKLGVRSSSQPVNINPAYASTLKVETNHIKREIKQSFDKIMPLLEYQVIFIFS